MTFEEFLDEWNDSNKFIKVKTSGSTGKPKEILLSKEFIKESAQRTISFFNLGKNSRFHSCVGADFIGGKMMAVRSSIADGEFTWENPSNQPLLGLKKHEVIDLLAVVPSQMIYLLENIDKTSIIRNIIIGGGVIHKDLRKKIWEAGLNAFETYGMTETASHIALRKIEKNLQPFKTLRGIKVSSDREETLIIHFDNGKEIKTNDLCDLISDTEFYIKGRRDYIINSGGRKINPMEVEEKIKEFIRNEFLVSSIEDEKWGEKLVLLIEKGDLNEISQEEIIELKEKLKKKLDPWEVPKEFFIIEKFKRTENGKIIRSKN